MLKDLPRSVYEAQNEMSCWLTLTASGTSDGWWAGYMNDQGQLLMGLSALAKTPEKALEYLRIMVDHEKTNTQRTEVDRVKS